MPALIETLFAFAGPEGLLPLAAIALVAVLLLGGQLGGGNRRK
jgi:hypothetical protein